MHDKKLKHLVIGGGEVGSAIASILNAPIHNPAKGVEQQVFSTRFLHICIPYSPRFIRIVKEYRLKFKARKIVVHSSVPIGTCISINATHSPIRGVHPNLVGGIKTFVKYFGGPNAAEASKEFRKLGIRTETVRSSKTTEALKLWDTTQYGLAILLNKYIHQWCEENSVDFNTVYTHANMTYNTGYSRMNRMEVVRPYLNYVKGPIGGHCVLPNAKLLDKKIFNILNSCSNL